MTLPKPDEEEQEGTTDESDEEEQEGTTDEPHQANIVEAAADRASPAEYQDGKAQLPEPLKQILTELHRESYEWASTRGLDTQHPLRSAQYIIACVGDFSLEEAQRYARAASAMVRRRRRLVLFWRILGSAMALTLAP